jgi:HK97 family phage major capsid protein
VKNLQQIVDSFEDLRSVMEARAAKQEEFDQKLLVEIAELRGIIDAQVETKGADPQLTNLLERVAEVERKAARPTPLTDDNAERPRVFAKSVKVLWESKQYKAHREAVANGQRPQLGAQVFEIPSVIGPREVKASFVATSEIDALVDNYRSPRVRMQPLDRIRVLDAITRVDTDGADRYEYMRETTLSGTATLYTQLAAAVVSGAGATATVDNAEGVFAGQLHYFHTAGGIETATVASLVIATGVVTYTGTLNFNAAIDDAVTCESYGAIAEGEVKPYGWFETELVSVDLQLIPVLMGVTQQSVNKFPTLLRVLETRMRSRARIVYTDHVLYGDGTIATSATTGELDGFFSDTDATQVLWSTTPANSNRIDAALIAGETVETQGYNTPVLCMNPSDWGTLTRLKDSTGQYLVAINHMVPFSSQPGAMHLDRFPVILDERIAANDFLAVDFTEASELADQGTAQFTTGFVGNDFEVNRFRIRYEETLAHAITNPGAFVLGEWDSAP